ncbi:MAG TPA: hypothetical protein VHP13_06895 [Gammaproteobacteria bacterium]|jgi:hypothetical protein|nr:hypothetical protein [Gammaproteobacteria bacterium]
MRLLAASALYFGLVFAAGFALGVLRSLWLAPRLGERRAELLEMPLMLGVSALAATVLARGPAAGFTPTERLAMGGLALLMLLAVELLLVKPMRGMSLRHYIAGRDPVALSAYLAALLGFALMPAWSAPHL